MTESRDPVNLRSLPQLDAPVGTWESIRAGLEETPADNRAGWPLWTRAAGIAAIAILAITLIVQTPAPEQPPAEQLAGETTRDENLDRLVSLSQGMEQRLEQYRDASGTMPGSHAAKVAELEDMVAVLDSQLAQNPESTTLWFQRVTLMSDLLGLYATQSGYDTNRYASL